jgi:hypothetical protein
MSFLNSGIDVTNFMGDSFDTGMAVNARNRADAYLKGGAAKRTGDLAKQGSGLFGYYKGKDLLADAGAYANQRAQNASTFGSIMGAVGGIGSMGVQGMFDPTKTFHDNALFGQTPFGSGGGTLPDVYGNEVGTLGPNWGIPQ